MNGINITREKLNYGLSIVTSTMGEAVNGLTVAWVMQTSHDPLLIAVSIGKSRETFKYISQSNVFSVNILAEGQGEIAKHFGLQSGRNVNKFEKVEYFISPHNNCPILKNVCAHLDCKVVNSVETGDHVIFVGNVLHGTLLNEGKSMVFDRTAI